mgnify:CR=1 FL=1
MSTLAGLLEADVKAWASESMASFLPPRIFAPMQSLIASFQRDPAWEVVVVSASSRWVVEAAAPSLGLRPEQVLGIGVAVEGGVLTDRVLEPVTNDVGKVAAVRDHFGRAPALAVGNSTHDVPLLASATELAMVVNPSPGLYQEAVRRGWGVCSLTPS